MGRGQLAERGRGRSVRAARRREPRLPADDARAPGRGRGAAAGREGTHAAAPRGGERRRAAREAPPEAREEEVGREDGVHDGRIFSPRGARAPVQKAKPSKAARVSRVRRRRRRPDADQGRGRRARGGDDDVDEDRRGRRRVRRRAVRQGAAADRGRLCAADEVRAVSRRRESAVNIVARRSSMSTRTLRRGVLRRDTAPPRSPRLDSTRASVQLCRFIDDRLLRSVTTPWHVASTPFSNRALIPVGRRCGASSASITAATLNPVSSSSVSSAVMAARAASHARQRAAPATASHRTHVS
mmetsp:Transcript_13095/g.47065  ORF Transcript_13095/g.47065 Transcript_13095/m.47065 type:complete len:299 (+) Transcript_13095:504-1400(+)